MVADQLLSYAQKWSIVRTVNLNDYSDKYHYLLMTTALMVLASLTTVKTYVFQPIICEVASKPSGINFPEYLSNLCWVEGTYPNYNPGAPLNITDSYWQKQPKAFYYQWVPFTLAIQAALFFLPRLIWLAYVHNREGPDLEALLENASEANKTVDWQLRKGLVDGISRSIDFMLMMREGAADYSGFGTRRSRWRRCLASRPRGCLSMAYAVIKLMFLANAIGQLYIIGVMLAPEFPAPLMFGFYLIGLLHNGTDWRATQLFPRVTLCRLKLYHLGWMNTYTGQCALPMNMLNEKIYCFLWVAAAAGAGLTCVSLIQWMLRITCGRGHWRHHLRRYLVQLRGGAAVREKELVSEFADYLHTEGIFLVHMLRLNVGEVIASDVANGLYRLWRGRRREQPAEDTLADADQETKFSVGPASSPSPSVRKDTVTVACEQAKCNWGIE